ncbi:PREDICTED: uncharacterized protein LOC106805631 [Priapulus caudatus]|uniref:Uncharacterized protein LOC106805631 n=1 Tax=Priapulus caudatus TaxID=37621 RepID=A0ABM1DS79_PRICU|nr:PREDICTED: uncharacterized protein LOC106805631 [Priapulus caudatus]
MTANLLSRDAALAHTRQRRGDNAGMSPPAVDHRDRDGESPPHDTVTVPERVAGGTVPERVAGGTVPERVAGGTVPERVAGGTVPERVAGGTVSERVARGTVPERVAAGTVPERVAAGTVPERVAGGTVPERVAGGTVPERVAGGTGPERVAGGTGPECVAADTVVTTLNLQRDAGQESHGPANSITSDNHNTVATEEQNDGNDGRRAVDDSGEPTPAADVSDVTECTASGHRCTKDKRSRDLSKSNNGFHHGVTRAAEITNSIDVDNTHCQGEVSQVVDSLGLDSDVADSGAPMQRDVAGKILPVPNRTVERECEPPPPVPSRVRRCLQQERPESLPHPLTRTLFVSSLPLQAPPPLPPKRTVGSGQSSCDSVAQASHGAGQSCSVAQQSSAEQHRSDDSVAPRSRAIAAASDAGAVCREESEATPGGGGARSDRARDAPSEAAVDAAGDHRKRASVFDAIRSTVTSVFSHHADASAAGTAPTQRKRAPARLPASIATTHARAEPNPYEKGERRKRTSESPSRPDPDTEDSFADGIPPLIPPRSIRRGDAAMAGTTTSWSGGDAQAPPHAPGRRALARRSNSEPLATHQEGSVLPSDNSVLHLAAVAEPSIAKPEEVRLRQRNCNGPASPEGTTLAAFADTLSQLKDVSRQAYLFSQ